MIMKRKKVLAVAAGVVVVFAALTSVTVTKQNEYKLIRQFGKVQRVIDKPGISLRVPLMETTGKAVLIQQYITRQKMPSAVCPRTR